MSANNGTNGHSGSLQKTILTPELAKLLSAPEKLHPRQRVVQRKVTEYIRSMKSGDWTLVYDPILIDKATGLLFNGLQRCTAVAKSGVSIPVYIDWEADASIFSKIDSGVPRNAKQFVKVQYSSAKVAAARIILWHERDSEQPLSARITYPMWEIIDRAEQLDEVFDRYARQIALIQKRLGISAGAMLAACALQDMAGNSAAVEEFIEGLNNPSMLTELDPAWVVFDKFSRRLVQIRRRQLTDDWNVFVRALNAHVNDERLGSRLSFSSPVTSLVGETERDLNRRRSAAYARIARVRKPVRTDQAARMEMRTDDDDEYIGVAI